MAAPSTVSSKSSSLSKQDFASTGWLQAFIGSPSPTIQKTRLEIKKVLDAIESLSSLTTIREKSDLLDESIAEIWRYTNSSQMSWLVRTIPAMSTDWHIEGCDEFSVSVNAPLDFKTADEWAAAMGIRDWSTQLTTKILKGDFVTWQRRVSRQGNSGQSHGFTYEVTGNSTLDLATTASWTANEWADGKWNFQIDGQPMMSTELDEPVITDRPTLESLMESIMFAISHADSDVREPKGVTRSGAGLPALLVSGTGSLPSWCDSVLAFKSIHQEVIASQETKFTARFQFVWSTVWPVLYSRRKRLRRDSCDLITIRQQLDYCFETEPALTRWIFVFGELLSQTFVGDGLGIAVKYRS